MDYHILKEIPANFDVLAFRSKVLGDRGFISQIPPSTEVPISAILLQVDIPLDIIHIFGRSYLDSDAYQAFVETGNILTKKLQLNSEKKFRKSRSG